MLCWECSSSSRTCDCTSVSKTTPPELVCDFSLLAEEFAVHLAKKRITIHHLNKACELEKLDSLGLDINQQHYLQVLLEGDSKLNVISSRIGLPSKTISDVIEPYLIRSGLVAKDEKSGRVLTSEGRIHAVDLRQARLQVNWKRVGNNEEYCCQLPVRGWFY